MPSLQIFNARPIDKAMKNLSVGADDNLLVDAVDIDMKKAHNMKKHKLNKPIKEGNEENTTFVADPVSEKKSKRKSRDLKDRPVTEEEEITKSKKVKHDEETVHLEATVNNENRNEKRKDDDDDKVGKKNKSKMRGSSAVQLLEPEAEVGLGGTSAWDE